MADVPPRPVDGTSRSRWLPENLWHHFLAGGLGGMCGAIVTSPFDVVETRLQSDLFKAKVANVSLSGNGVASVIVPRRNLIWHFVETGQIMSYACTRLRASKDIYREESPRALFKGLGPTLVGVVPASCIKFYTYGNGKHIIAERFNNGEENSWVHLSAATISGIVTGTATNPIWVKIMREEGARGFYKGLSANYLGVTEGTIQWVLYERLKRLTARTEGKGGLQEWFGMLGSAGTAKCAASLITYPHEVLRTRLRQPLVDGKVKYTGLLQTLRLVIAEEGARLLYGGLSAHLMRVIPNAAVMYSIYEAVLRMA
ncbi:mitochondrial carrier [Trametes sanguinea]|nr:mitochondrial carrier [Trametes sanguinea]